VTWLDKWLEVKLEINLARWCRFLDPDPTLLIEDANKSTRPKLHALNKAMVQLVGVLISDILIYYAQTNN
jgi:hypothetical protein